MVFAQEALYIEMGSLARSCDACTYGCDHYIDTHLASRSADNILTAVSFISLVGDNTRDRLNLAILALGVWR